MILLRIINVALYVSVIYFLYNRFIDTDFFSHIGGAEVAFLLLIMIGVCWAGLISYGLVVSANWGFNHAVWLNGAIIFILLFKLSMAALNGEFLAQDFVVQHVSSLVIATLLFYSCIIYIRRKKPGAYAGYIR